MMQNIKLKVAELLTADRTGHGMDHIERVLNLSLQFVQQEQGDIELVSLIALLHDVDDYKLFGFKRADTLPNAAKIMMECGVKTSIQNHVLDAIRHIGFSKRLKGLTPLTKEAQIVSDADMCDAMGAQGLLRAYAYSFQNHEIFFDRHIFPLETMTADQYTSKRETTTVCHLFEKILKLKRFMLTASGRQEATKREQILIDFLRQFFIEESALEWIQYLNQFIKENR